MKYIAVLLLFLGALLPAQDLPTKDQMRDGINAINEVRAMEGLPPIYGNYAFTYAARRNNILMSADRFHGFSHDTWPIEDARDFVRSISPWLSYHEMYELISMVGNEVDPENYAMIPDLFLHSYTHYTTLIAPHVTAMGFHRLTVDNRTYTTVYLGVVR